jgi:hypothetical protein
VDLFLIEDKKKIHKKEPSLDCIPKVSQNMKGKDLALPKKYEAIFM